MIGSYRGRVFIHAGGRPWNRDTPQRAKCRHLRCGVRSRILELLFGQPADPKYSALLEDSARHLREDRRGAAGRKTPRRLRRPVHASFARQVKVAVKGGKLVFSVPGYDKELRRQKQDTYVIWDPPLAGALIRFKKTAAAGRRSLWMPTIPTSRVSTRSNSRSNARHCPPGG